MALLPSLGWRRLLPRCGRPDQAVARRPLGMYRRLTGGTPPALELSIVREVTGGTLTYRRSCCSSRSHPQSPSQNRSTPRSGRRDSAVFSRLRRDERPGRGTEPDSACSSVALVSTRVQLPRDELRSASAGGGSAGLDPRRLLCRPGDSHSHFSTEDATTMEQTQAIQMMRQYGMFNAEPGGRTLRWGRRVTVNQWEQGVVFRYGRLVGTVGPGDHRRWRRGFTMRSVDLRPWVVLVPTQEIPTADGVTLKLTIAGHARITDAVVYVIEPWKRIAAEHRVDE